MQTATYQEQTGIAHESLPLLYQGLLTAIVRIRSGRQQIGDASAFQRRMEDLLIEIEREAIKAGYRKEEIDEAHYAVVAFLDESIYSSADPGRAQWASLGAKLYSQAIAGEGLFERLKSIRVRRESPDLADLLEVYYLCFALGYEGRYAVSNRSEFQSLMHDLRDQIDRIRGRRDRLSPHGEIPPRTQRAASIDRVLRQLQIAAVITGAFALLSWIVYKLVLVYFVQIFPSQAAG